MAHVSDDALVRAWLKECIAWTHWRAYNISEVSYDEFSLNSAKATLTDENTVLVVQSKSVENKNIRTLHPIPVLLRHEVTSKDILKELTIDFLTFEASDDLCECDLCVPECCIPEPDYVEV